MQLKHVKSITQPSDGIVKVTAICWAPNGKRLAVCTTDRVVLMFDEDGVRKDKFSTKPATDKGPKNYIVKQMVFSPQSDKLAIAQSDNMVFVYKIGSEWGDKKSICNKFQHTSSITCLTWPYKRTNEIVYGLAEGKVKIGQMKARGPATLYPTDSYVTAICCNPTGNAVVSAHLDGSIYTFWFDSIEKGAHVIARHPCVPFALTWGGSICVAGNDCQITFYDEDGGEEHTFDHSHNPACREFTAAATNPTGDAVALGNFNSLYVYARNKDTMGWEEKSVTQVENMYSVTAMDWKPDGDKLAVGTLCGVVDFYDICVKRTMYKGGFEMTYVSHSQVIVRQMETNLRIVVRSQYGCEILKTNIRKNRFVIANTTDTLLLGDLDTLKLSEIQWHGDGSEKFIFDNSSACVIYFAGEVSIVEYGLNEILGSIRTQQVSGHVFSLRINERPPKTFTEMEPQEGDSPMDHHPEDNKKVAYLLDSQTICIKDLISQSSVTISHDSKIDWLELNGRATLLLFRDKRRHLHLYKLDSQERSQLLTFCTYVQWVPNSDVVVAQNRQNLCVWYNIHAPDQITTQAIKGDVEEIERADGRTEVIVDEGMSQAVYPLDESLIDFGTAVDDNDLEKAMDILDALVVTPEVEAMWSQLNSLAVQSGDLRIAQRCAAAVGDVAISSYLGQVKDIKMEAEEELGFRAADHYKVSSKMSLLKKDLLAAEKELLNQGRIDECIDMYQKLGKHDLAIRVAEENRHRDAPEMRQAYFQYLLDTNQEDAAAALKERECNFEEAIRLYLKGGMPGKAAQVVITHDILQPVQMLDQVATALTRAGMHDKAGEFYERLNELPRALDSYVRGHAFSKAVALAKRSFHARVVDLQEQWGDYLVSQKQIDMAINHYIEANVKQKAVEAALNARQFAQALRLVDSIENNEASKPYYKQLARHHEDIGHYDLAERCYIAADEAHSAVEMQIRLGHFEMAHKLASNYMSEGEVGLLYINQAQKFEVQDRLREAEKLYLTVKEKDLAINMYKKHRRFDDMIRLVQEHRRDQLKETHKFIALTMEMETSFRDAEHHYVEADEWGAAVNMYRQNDLWDDAIRVAKFHGGVNACKRVTTTLLMAVGVVEGMKFLAKHGLVEAAIDQATETGHYEMAFEIAQSMEKKLPEIHLKYALFLEDDEKYAEAEEEFIKAGKPKEAIDMYVHNGDWTNALRVAESYDPSVVPDVYVAQAGWTVTELRNYSAAEELFIQASRPELALDMYQEADMWQEAQRFSQRYLPHRVTEVTMRYQQSQARAGKGTTKSDFLSTGRSLEQEKRYAEAIDNYLAANKAKVDLLEDLEELWDRAIEIAHKYVPNRHVEVAVDVSRRLIELKREEPAADVLVGIGRLEEAVDMLIESRLYEKAKALAQGNAMLRRRVEDAYQGHLVSKEDHKELVNIGHSDVALDVLAKRGDWERVWEVAAKERLSTNALAKYVIMCIDELVDNGSMKSLDQAVRTLNERTGPSTDKAVDAYKRLVKAVLSQPFENEDDDLRATVAMMREVFFRLASSFKSGGSDKLSNPDFEDLLMATHYQKMLNSARQSGLRDVAVKTSITLLKYPSIIPQDKAFYQAGIVAKEAGITNLAFMLLNRYVDLAEAIDTNDASFMDNSEYQDVDAIHDTIFAGPLPSVHYIRDEDTREEVRTWVLSVVTDSSVEQRFPTRERSRGTMYEGLFHSERPTCIVTGFPVHPADMLEVNNSVANRKDWNAYVSKARLCPWTGQPQNPIY